MSTFTITINWWSVVIGFILGYLFTVTMCLVGCLMNDKLMKDDK